MLVITNATRRFGSLTVFGGINFRVDEGCACAIVGSNGSGKTTLLRCISGADRLDEGTISLFATEVDESSPVFRSRVASVLDDPGTFPHLTVSEHLQLVAAAHGAPNSYEIATEVLEGVGLGRAADQLPGTLSSGQRRRLALGSVFVRPRKMLVLDEPEQRLDTAGRKWLAAALVREKQSGCIVVMASHDRELVSSVADTTLDGDVWPR
ncbi:ABC transporter ATP-binding protein [Rhodococcus sp. 1163]|uniref:ABC transporter ATP-binding protein n=1 Tax=unclassified Rhodococcus (in: high G+C Gram-positive bacteria) TaxID=192944 RepID=UPI0009FF2430|nr:ABC transporter ATP-binding protein [Rhodococcus sp. 1163]ORI11734.1 ABC transporter ATP-binding protein [Rhodococcus sp. 1163]